MKDTVIYTVDKRNVSIDEGAAEHYKSRGPRRPSLADQASIHQELSRLGIPVDSHVVLTAFRDRLQSRPSVAFSEKSDDEVDTEICIEDPDAKTQSSILTIFALWNTMMGSSLLCMPWAVAQAGLVGGIVFIVLMGALCYYTAFRTYDSQRFVESAKDVTVEFTDICEKVLGRWAKWCSMVFAILPLIGAIIVFWVLMSTFARNISVFLYDWISGELHSSSDSGLVCPSNFRNSSRADAAGPEGEKVLTGLKAFLASKVFWPLILVVLLFPIINLKDPGFFYKFTSLGTVSVLYLVIYLLYKSFAWGLHVDFSDSQSKHYMPLIGLKLPSLTGILCVSYYLHNAVISMLRYNKNQENNVRDLGIGYGLVAVTYFIIGVPFYLTFPLDKGCIQDNFLNNFVTTDIMAAVTRTFLLLQFVTLFPMIAYIIRSQTLHSIFGDSFPNRIVVLILNAILVLISVIFAIFYPDVGDVLRYCGAISGLMAVFLLPLLVYMVALYRKGELRIPSAGLHILIILLSVVNFCLQFTV